MPAQPPKKPKLPKKPTSSKPAPHAPTSTKPVNLVTFTFDHPITSFISKYENPK